MRLVLGNGLHNNNSLYFPTQNVTMEDAAVNIHDSPSSDGVTGIVIMVVLV